MDNAGQMDEVESGRVFFHRKNERNDLHPPPLPRRTDPTLDGDGECRRMGDCRWERVSIDKDPWASESQNQGHLGKGKRNGIIEETFFYVCMRVCTRVNV